MDHLEVAIVLAAGEGTRMKSATSKVLHPIAGKPIIQHVLRAVDALSADQVRVVVGAHREAVESTLQQIAPAAISVFQAERNGTGHAVQLALKDISTDGTVLILAGDTPLISPDTLQEFLRAHLAQGSDASVLSAMLPDPFGYGRIIRDDYGNIDHIVEERDATEEERSVDEVNTGVYLFNLTALRKSIAQLTTNNSQGELYLTDVIALIKSNDGSATVILSNDYTETLGINDRTQLAEAAACMRDRINDQHMKNGVTIIDPFTTWIDIDVAIEKDVTIYPGSALSGKTSIASGAVVGPRSTLIDAEVARDAQIVESQVTGATIGPNATVGPFSFIRPGTVLGPSAKVGAYVEVKNSSIGEGSKVPHLSYVGDATIGKGTNIGAATIFANYDGVNKYQTFVGDDVRIGSDNVLVAPVTVGDGAYTAAGSVINEDVPAGSMAVARAKQRNILGWVLRKRSGSKSAQAAERAGTTIDDKSVTPPGNGASE
ncbi:MAG: bifunctional UDP-N-acetylglucosamine diphosphorylase/glucosamine-1-phosphate N-acetyltransferase GlmU [Actinomycetes bacterium]